MDTSLLSPLDGRYAQKVSTLAAVMGEDALLRGACVLLSGYFFNGGGWTSTDIKEAERK